MHGPRLERPLPQSCVSRVESKLLPQAPTSSKPLLSQRAKTYITQYVPCAMEGFWLGHVLGDKEHTEGFLIANVFVPAGAAAKRAHATTKTFSTDAEPESSPAYRSESLSHHGRQRHGEERADPELT